MEELKKEQQLGKRKNVRWEYVLEPENKPTYWDHAALSTEERRARGRRTVFVKEPRALKSLEQEDAQTKTEMLSSSIKGQLEEPCETEILKDDDDDDNVPIYKLLNKTPLSSQVNTPAVKNMIGVRCAERGMSGMLLWQHEFYFVFESEELCRRQHSPPKPYLYQALEFRKGSDLPEEAKVGMTRKQLGEMWVLGVSYAPSINIRMYGKRAKGYLFHTDFNDTDARTGLFWKCPEVVRVDNSQAWREMSKVLLMIPVGMLRVRACWHDVVFRNELCFTESMFLY